MPQNLLDTHTFIWFVEGSKELSALARKSVKANDTTNYISIASLWEIAIKISLHKLQLTTAFYQLNTVIANNGFEVGRALKCMMTKFYWLGVLTDQPFFGL